MMSGTFKTGFYKITKKSFLNACLALAPLIISVSSYFFTNNLIITLAIFIVGQMLFSFYYSQYIPVPGYNKAYRLFLKRDFSNSSIILNQILEKHPNSYESLVLLGAIHINKLEYKQAIDVLEKASEIRPEEPTSNINLSNAYTALEEFPEAIKCSQRVIKTIPSNWSAYYNTAICKYFLEEYEDSINNFKKVLSFNIPKNQIFLVHYGLAKAYEKLNNDDNFKTELKNTTKTATDSSLKYWQSQLNNIGEFTNKPSAFVKEAVEYCLNTKDKDN